MSVHTYSIFSLLHPISSQGSLGNYWHYFSFWFLCFFFLPPFCHVRKIFKDKPLQDKNFIILFLPLSFFNVLCHLFFFFFILFTVFQESQEVEERNKKLMGKQDPRDKCIILLSLSENPGRSDLVSLIYS